MDKILKFFDFENESIKLQADKLYSVLTRLRYEGRAFSVKNLKAALARVKALDALMKEHQGIQEKVIFPFLLTHVPRLEAVIQFLETEHEDICASEARFKENIQKLSKQKGALETGEVYSCGVYLVSLLKQHTGFESRSIHKAIYDELRDDEKAVVVSRIKKCLGGRKSRRALR